MTETTSNQHSEFERAGANELEATGTSPVAKTADAKSACDAPAAGAADRETAETASADAAAPSDSDAQAVRATALRTLIETGRHAAFAHPRGEAHETDREHAREERIRSIADAAFKELGDDEVAAFAQALARVNRALNESCDIPDHPHGRPFGHGRSEGCDRQTDHGAGDGHGGRRGGKRFDDHARSEGHGRSQGHGRHGEGRPEGFGADGGHHNGHHPHAHGNHGHGFAHGHDSASASRQRGDRGKESSVDVHGDPIAQGFTCPRGKRPGVDCPTCFPQCGFGRARYT